MPLLPHVPKTVCAEGIPWTHEHTATRPHVSRPPAPERICLRACGAWEAGREGETGGVMKELWPSCGLQIPQGSVHLLIFFYSALLQNLCEHTVSSCTLVRQRCLKKCGRIKKKKKVFELLIFLFFPISTKNYFSRAGRCIFYFLRKIIGNMNPNTKSQPGIARRHPRVPYNCKN